MAGPGADGSGAGVGAEGGVTKGAYFSTGT